MAEAKFNTVHSVFFNNGEQDLLALVVTDRGGGSLDLIVFDPQTGVSSLHREIPRRDVKDYDEAGGGKTWHA